MKINDRLHAFPWQSMSSNNCNSYLIDGTAKILIDPGHLAHFDHVKNGLKALNLDLSNMDLVICTHAHPDHFEAVQLFKQASVKVAMHETDWRLAESFGQMFGASFDIHSLIPDIFLTEGNFKAGDMEFDVIHAPGHSPGSIALYWKDEKALFTGDVIFKDGLGRTDLPGGSGRDLKDSIQRLASLETAIFLPGHGDVLLDAGEIKRNFKRVRDVWFNYI